MSADNHSLHLPDSVDIVLSGIADDMQISREELITLALNSYIKANRLIRPEAIASLKDAKRPMHDGAWDMAWFAFLSEVEEAEIRHRLAVAKARQAAKPPAPGPSPQP